MNLQPVFFRQFIIVLLDNHALQLRYNVRHIFLFMQSHINANNHIRSKLFFHHTHGEIIVNAAVKHRQAISFYWLESHRKRHRHPYGFAQIASTQHHFFFIINIRRHTTKRDKQIVKIARANCRVRRKHFHEPEIHRDRID